MKKTVRKPIHPLWGRRMFVPRMSTVGAEMLCAAFRSFGIEAKVTPLADEKAKVIASRFVTGEECLPQRVTLADFFKAMESPDFDPSRTAFFMPTSSGPCRFGQYANFFRKILRELGYSDVYVFSPTSSNQYEDIGGNVLRFKRTAWRAVVASDALRKLTYQFRPYAKDPREVDEIHDRTLKALCEVLENPEISIQAQLHRLAEIIEMAKDQIQRVTFAEEPGSRPLIGMVGEIFIRFNSESNQHLVRKIEAHGGEVWIADVSEWVWYTSLEQVRRLKESGKSFSFSMLAALVRNAFQRWDEERILSSLKEIFKNRKEARVETLLQYARAYLPHEKAMGEMTLNTGKAIAFYRAGCDGVIDASPFTCMNGIVTEAIYPRVSRDCEGMPIRIFYFDGIPLDLDSALEIFMELAREYRLKRLKKNHLL